MKKQTSRKRGASIGVASQVGGSDFFDDLLPDERHIAYALYMLVRVVAGRHIIPDAEMHGSLRDASMHAEEARKRWTKGEIARIEALGRKIFGEPDSPNNSDDPRTKK